MGKAYLRIWLFLLWFVGISIDNHLFAQSNAKHISLTGHIVDSTTRKPVPYATVAVLDSCDRPIKMAAAQADGSFLLPINVAGHYKLAVTCVGYLPFSKDIFIQNVSYDCGVCNLKPNMQHIDAVTVTVPLVTVNDDRLTYNVDSDPDAASSQLIDIIAKVPQLSVEGLDNVRLNGSSRYIVLVNGRKSNMYNNNFSQIIKVMPAAAIQSIEVITNPSSKYDADDLEGIINIVTKKRTTGYIGAFAGQYNIMNSSYELSNYTAVNSGKFNFSAMVSYTGDIADRYHDKEEQEIFSPEYSKMYVDLYNGPRRRIHAPKISFESSYDFDKHNLLTFSLGYSYLSNKPRSFLDQKETDSEGNVIQEFRRAADRRNRTNNWNAGLDFQHSFKNPKEIFTFSYRFAGNKRDNDNFLHYTGAINFDAYEQEIDNFRHSDEHTFQVDYINPLNKKNEIEVGGKYILRFNDSRTDRYLQNDFSDEWQPDNDGRNDINYVQHVYAVYGSYLHRFNLMNLKMGVRCEGTHNDARVYTDTERLGFSTNYFNIIPYLSLTFKSEGGNNYRISYTQRISRPGIGYLNPYVDDSDPEHIIYGNPRLKSVVTHNLSANFTKNTKRWTWVNGLSTKFSSQQVSRYTDINDDGIFETTYRNIGRYWNSGVNTSFSYRFENRSSINVSGMFGYARVQAESENLNNEGLTYSATLSTSIALFKNTFANVYVAYVSPDIRIQEKTDGYFGYYVTLRQKLFDQKLDLNLMVLNPFPKNLKIVRHSKGTSFRGKTVERVEKGYCILSASYRFGKTDVKVRKAKRKVVNDDKMQEESRRE